MQGSADPVRCAAAEHGSHLTHETKAFLNYLRDVLHWDLPGEDGLHTADGASGSSSSSTMSPPPVQTLQQGPSVESRQPQVPNAFH